MQTQVPAAAAALVTLWGMSACATVPQHRAAIQLDAACPATVQVTHCITGEQLRRFGPLNTADALRYALFPWVRLE